MPSILKYRVAGMRAFDLVLTVAVLWAFFGMLRWKRGKASPANAAGVGFLLALLCTLPLAIFFHALFGVPTALTCATGLADRSKCAALKVRLGKK